MGEKVIFNTGNIYIATPTGYQPFCSLNDIVDTTTTLDEAFEEEKIINQFSLSNCELIAEFKIHPRSRNRFYRTISGWKTSGPIRWRQFAKCYKRGWVS